MKLLLLHSDLLRGFPHGSRTDKRIHLAWTETFWLTSRSMVQSICKRRHIFPLLFCSLFWLKHSTAALLHLKPTSTAPAWQRSFDKVSRGLCQGLSSTSCLTTETGAQGRLSLGGVTMHCLTQYSAIECSTHWFPLDRIQLLTDRTVPWIRVG